MRNNPALQVQEGQQPSPDAAAAHDVAGLDDVVGPDHMAGPDHHEVAPAAVLPSPLHFLAAGTVGGLAGLAAVYLVATRLAGTLDAVAAIILIFAVTMSGPWVHARSDTELGRVIAVALQSVAFGAALGGLIVMT